MMYFKAPRGKFVRYVEVADDQFANRQVDVSDGEIHWYDRDHRRDHLGFLLGLRFSRKPKWLFFFPEAVIIKKEEFEKIWRFARNL